MDLFAIASGVAPAASFSPAQAAGAAGLQINLFWVIIASPNFLIFAVLLYWLFGKPLTRMLGRAAGADRAGPARRRAGAQGPREPQRPSAWPPLPRRVARRTRSSRAPRRSPRSRATRTSRRRKAELERMRERATAEIEAEKQRAMAELRGEVADLALRGRRPRRRRDDDRRAPAPARRGVPARPARRAVRRLRQRRRADGPPRHGAAALRGGGLRDRGSATGRVELWRASSTRPRPTVGRGRRWTSSPTRRMPLDQRLDVGAARARHASASRCSTSSGCSSGAARSSSCRASPPSSLGSTTSATGIDPATATSAVPLGQEEVRAIATRLEAMTGGRVVARHDVDPAIIGGLTVRIGDRLIDASVRGRLERLRERLAAGTLNAHPPTQPAAAARVWRTN